MELFTSKNFQSLKLELELELLQSNFLLGRSFYFFKSMTLAIDFTELIFVGLEFFYSNL